MPNRSSLLWRCRRGIREMDILLQRFVEQEYDSLTTEQMSDFERLLDEADLDILEWITGKSKPATASMQKLITRIRDVNQARN